MSTIQEKIDRLKLYKTEIKSAINGRESEQPVDENMAFYAPGIWAIPQGGDTKWMTDFMNGNQVTSIPQDFLDSLNSVKDYGLSYLTMPDNTTLSMPNVTSVGGYAFDHSKFDVSLPELRTAGVAAFSAMNTEQLDLPNLTALLEQSGVGGHFVSCKAKSINIPRFEGNIPPNCFNNCTNLETVNLGTIEVIGREAFSLCSKLKSISYNDAVTSVGGAAFNYCSSLNGLHFSCLEETAGTNEFINVKGVISFAGSTKVPVMKTDRPFGYSSVRAIFVVPDALYDEWITATNWSKFTQYIFKESDAQYFVAPHYMLEDKEVTTFDNEMSRRVKTVKAYAFYLCSNLCRVVLPEATIIEDFTFSDIGGTPNTDVYIYIPKLESFGYYAFGSLGRVNNTMQNNVVIDFGNERTTVLASCPSFTNNTNNFDKFTIIVPDALYDEWKETSTWVNYKDRIVKYSEYYNS